MHTRLRLGRIQKEILDMLDSSGDLTVAFLTSGMSSKSLWRAYNRQRMHERVKQSLAHLEKRKVVHIRRKNGEQYVTLLRKGRQESFSFENLQLEKNEKWNGKWHIVIFDIPEKYSKARRALSAKIQKMGAFRLQKSVYVYPYPWKNEIDFVATFFQVESHIRYIEAVSIEGERELRERFQL